MSFLRKPSLFGRQFLQLHKPQSVFTLSSLKACNSGQNSVNFGSQHLFQRLIPLSEYVSRVQRLVDKVNCCISEDKTLDSQNGALIVISGAPRIYVADTRIPSIHFKQNSDFLYFTGLNTKEAAHSVFVIVAEKNSFKSWLFSSFSKEEYLVWEGSGLQERFYKDHLSSITNYHEDLKHLPKFIRSHSSKHVFLTRAGLNLQPPSISGHQESKVTFVDNPLSNTRTTNVSHLIDRLRLEKSSNELNCMRRTCQIGSNAMNLTREWAQTQIKLNQSRYAIEGVFESQIAAKFEFEARNNGACKLSYPPVVAGDCRSTVIHYGANDKPVKLGEWILMDAGCEDIEGYTSDITRSWPINGEKSSKFKLTQEIYDALSEIQSNLITFVAKNWNEICLNDVYVAMCHGLSDILMHFGLASNRDEAIMLADHFCPHHVSHYLGLDVHDSPIMNRKEKLTNGMCFTIEPGLYFRESDPKVKKDFYGIGLRVEDNFAINHEGLLENLTESCPRLFSSEK